MLFGSDVFGFSVFAGTNQGSVSFSLWKEHCPAESNWENIPKSTDLYSKIPKNFSSWDKIISKEGTIERC